MSVHEEVEVDPAAILKAWRIVVCGREEYADAFWLSDTRKPMEGKDTAYARWDAAKALVERVVLRAAKEAT